MFASGKTASASSGASSANYIEDVFSTYLYTGNGSTQTITNGIDLSGEGGMIWRKSRSDISNNQIIDTNRGIASFLTTNTTDAASTGTNWIASFDSSGFTMNSNSFNGSPYTYASWTFRKQPKFFDVVTYTGNGVNGRAISHNLGSTPGFIVVKCTSSAAQWVCWHRAYNSGNGYGYLNDTTAWFNTGADVWGNGTTYTAPTSTTFTVNGDSVGNMMNGTGDTYVAYLFAHDAGGFGLTGTDNVISCGSYVGTSANFVDVNLGYEPQWFMVKKADATGPWYIIDNMRDMSYSGTSNLQANASNAEQATVPQVIPSATGISLGYSGGGSSYNVNGTTYIYIAIRRGPMKVPTSGTSVFDPEAYTGTSATRTITSGFPVDLSISKIRSQNYPGGWFDRLRGALQVIRSSNTDPEVASPDSLTGFDVMTGVTLGGGGGGRINTSPDTYAMWNFRRAPSFFDEVCWTPNGSANDRITHNLGVPPELIITKTRTPNAGDNWWTYSASLGRSSYLALNTTDAAGTITDVWGTSNPTSTDFGMKDTAFGYDSTYREVAYLFATCAGVSKVGSYTGTGTTKQIDCGFTGGARFVLIKRTDSTGDWYVWDSARGIVSGNDPYLLLNSTAAEVTNTDYVDTYSAGFEISSTAPAAINASGGTFIFLAIA